MSWLSKLGKLAEIVGIAAIPFTGGASAGISAAAKGASMASKVGKVANVVSKVAPLVGKVAGDTSAARAGARVAEAGLNATQDNAALNRAVIDNNLTQSKQDSAFKNGLRAGVKDFHVTRPDGVPDGRATGGVRPSAIVNGNAMGAKFQADDLASLMAGTPELTPPPQAGKFDKFLNLTSGLSGLAGLAGQAKNAFGGGSVPPPQVNTFGKVNTDPNALMDRLPGIGDTGIAPPVQATYRPKFTMPQQRF